MVCVMEFVVSLGKEEASSQDCRVKIKKKVLPKRIKFLEKNRNRGVIQHEMMESENRINKLKVLHLN